MERLKKVIERYKNSRVRVEIGSETGMEDSPEYRIQEEKRGKGILKKLGIKLTFRF
ncbi:splicing factor 4 [Hydrogenobacter thermophilus TK-6]|uniref:Uncharacterized protein n=1 Tax=Hydrogenobacter thermophilus (strain DSM 6534 / IAM 12695 / TK-6) TaxID=608538 RepID=D3DGS1_HYDTT|nr:hypothetical protein [Hydrogenobacter thermophilus]ADO44958.1 splicing factor 4 [Hydrogenobacter thermophilus TK-6]BAI69023.1 hypothetical protein HTH_0561 [Hydrogenobacter thermophilus TK-6]